MTAIGSRLSVIGYRLSVIGYRLSSCFEWSSLVGWRSVMSYELWVFEVLGILDRHRSALAGMSYELWVIEFFCILDRRRSALGYGLRRDETPARSLGSGCATTDVTYQFPGFSGHRRASDAFASRLSPISLARELKL